MDKVAKILEVVRGSVRPFMAITGWVVGLVLMICLAVRFADKELALMVIGPIIGAIIALVNQWVGGRNNAAKEKNKEE